MLRSLIKIDKIDKKIIRELGINARLTYKDIARHINSKKEIVAYHITKLENDKVIKKYIPVFSLAKLGIFVHKIYLRFQGLTREEEHNLIKDIKENEYINWISKSVGTWDLMLAFYCKNILEFARKKEEFFEKYGKYIQEYSITMNDDVLINTRDYFQEEEKRERAGLVYGGEYSQEKIDDDQKAIIRLIRNNGRYELIDISRKLGLNVKTVLKKIRDLEDKGIIQGYITIIDHEKLGVEYYKVHIYLKDFSSKNFNKVFSYLKRNRYVVNLIKCIGNWDLELEAEAETSEEMYQLAKDLRIEFPEIIKRVDLFPMVEVKIDYLPAWY